MSIKGKEGDMDYLLVNICDLDSVGKLGGLGSPFLLAVQESLGDKILREAVFNTDRVDEAYIIIETSPERAQALADFAELIGVKKIGRKVRTIIRHSVPSGAKWHYITSNVR